MLVKCRALPKIIIMVMDGGICSQMHFYLAGHMLAQRGQKVRFDLRWFRESGMDLDNRFCRNFDLLKLFPYLDFTEARPGLLTRLYLSAFYQHLNYFDAESDPFAWLGIRAPKYVDGYLHDPEQMFSEYFRKVFRIDPANLDTDCLDTLRHIRDTSTGYETCAVHVRRGDLSKYNEAYGEPADVSYFRDACHAVSKHAGGPVRFYIFSDEPEWCAKHLLAPLDGISAEIMTSNGSDRGYCDLALMSHCRHIITSQGSMGKYAAMLREEKDLDGLVVLPDTTYSTPWLRRFKNAAAIDVHTAD